MATLKIELEIPNDYLEGHALAEGYKTKVHKRNESGDILLSERNEAIMIDNPQSAIDYSISVLKNKAMDSIAHDTTHHFFNDENITQKAANDIKTKLRASMK